MFFDLLVLLRNIRNLLNSICNKNVYKMIIERLKHHLYSTTDAEKAGFRPGSSCTEHITTFRILIEQCLEHRSDLSMGFIDFEKAFDSIHRDCIWTTLRNRAVPEQNYFIIRATYLHPWMYFISGGLFNCSRGRFVTCSQTTPSFRNQVDHDKFSTASGLFGRYLPFRT